MSDHRTTDVYHTFLLITKYLGDAFTLDEIIQFVEQCRGKEVILIEQVLPIGTTGFCFAFKDVDLIVVRQGLNRVRRITACLHECAHFLLRHIPRVSAGPTTTTFAEFVGSGVLRQAVYRSQATAYDEEEEHDAETLATMLMACTERKEQEDRGLPDMPKFVEQFWR